MDDSGRSDLQNLVCSDYKALQNTHDSHLIVSIYHFYIPSILNKMGFTLLMRQLKYLLLRCKQEVMIAQFSDWYRHITAPCFKYRGVTRE